MIACDEYDAPRQIHKQPTVKPSVMLAEHDSLHGYGVTVRVQQPMRSL